MLNYPLKHEIEQKGKPYTAGSEAYGAKYHAKEEMFCVKYKPM